MTKHKPRIPRSDDSLWNNFKEQASFLINAANQYDQGQFFYMKEAATHLRVLFHQTDQSCSLMNQLMKDQARSKTFMMVNADNLTSYHGEATAPADLNPGHVIIEDQVIDATHVQQVYIPEILAAPLTFSTFHDWWQANIFVFAGNPYTRESLIKFLANQNGGAHVDPKYCELFDEKLDLNQGTISGHTIQGSSLADIEHTDHIDGLAYAHLRLITQETLLSLNKAFGVPKAKEIPQMGNYPWLIHYGPKTIEDRFTTIYTITQVDDDAD